MTALVFVDTNVLLYTYDDRDPIKRDRAREWVRWCWRSRTGRISSQVLNELYNNAITKFREAIPLQQARSEVRRLRLWQPPHLDTYTVDGAWNLQDRYPLSYWDALIVSSAHQQGCTHVLTEDLQHGQTIDSVRIVNPFLISLSEFEAAA
jgi:predicted nucleic acid-binding protein